MKILNHEDHRDHEGWRRDFLQSVEICVHPRIAFSCYVAELAPIVFVIFGSFVVNPFQSFWRRPHAEAIVVGTSHSTRLMIKTIQLALRAMVNPLSWTTFACGARLDWEPGVRGNGSAFHQGGENGLRRHSDSKVLRINLDV